MGQTFSNSSNPPSSPRDRGGGSHGSGRGDRLRTAIFFPSSPSPGQSHHPGDTYQQDLEFCIKFPDIAHASAYADIIARHGRKQHVTRQGRSVYMKLPDSVRRLERRESLGGFVFSFRSSGRAYDFEDDLFRVVDHRDTKRPPTEVVLRERWRPGELDSIFGVNTTHSNGHGNGRPRSSHAGVYHEKDAHRERGGGGGGGDRERERSVRPRSSHHGEMREKGSPPRQSRPSSRISQVKY